MVLYNRAVRNATGSGVSECDLECEMVTTLKADEAKRIVKSRYGKFAESGGHEDEC